MNRALLPLLLASLALASCASNQKKHQWAMATEAEVDRMVELGILVPRDGAAPFLATDAQKAIKTHVATLQRLVA